MCLVVLFFEAGKKCIFTQTFIFSLILSIQPRMGDNDKDSGLFEHIFKELTQYLMNIKINNKRKIWSNFVWYFFEDILINLIFIWVYPRKRGLPDLPHSHSNLSNSHSSSRSIQGILLLQANTLALLHLHLPCLLWLSSLSLALHFKLQCFSQNMPITPPQHMPVPSCTTGRNNCMLNYRASHFSE